MQGQACRMRASKTPRTSTRALFLQLYLLVLSFDQAKRLGSLLIAFPKSQIACQERQEEQVLLLFEPDMKRKQSTHPRELKEDNTR